MSVLPLLMAMKLIPAGEGDVVAAVILPVGDLGAVDVVAEGDHASGGGPALLAVPVGAVGGTDLVHVHVRNGCGGGSGAPLSFSSHL